MNGLKRYIITKYICDNGKQIRAIRIQFQSERWTQGSQVKISNENRSDEKEWHSNWKIQATTSVLNQM